MTSLTFLPMHLEHFEKSRYVSNVTVLSNMSMSCIFHMVHIRKAKDNLKYYAK